MRGRKQPNLGTMPAAGRKETRIAFRDLKRRLTASIGSTILAPF